MSHFSKIKTNITNLDVLIKTVKQLGFDYKFFSNDDNNLSINRKVEGSNVYVYKLNKMDTEVPVFNFIRSGNEYSLLVDLELWGLDVDFNYLLDRVFQQYAYNIIINTSCSNGFQKVQEQINYDGSIKLTLQKWHSN